MIILSVLLNQVMVSAMMKRPAESLDEDDAPDSPLAGTLNSGGGA